MNMSLTLSECFELVRALLIAHHLDHALHTQGEYLENIDF